MSSVQSAINSEEARLLAAAQAARSERRNSPRYLIIGAALVLALALLWLLMSYRSFAAAKATLAKQLSDRETIARNVSELQQLKAANSTDNGPRLAEQEGAIRTRLREIGKAAGLKEENITPKAVRREQRKDLGSVLLTASFDARDESLAPLFSWLERTVAEMPGVEVYKISIRPEAQKWYMQVTFSRWEKPETK